MALNSQLHVKQTMRRAARQLLSLRTGVRLAGCEASAGLGASTSGRALLQGTQQVAPWRLHGAVRSAWQDSRGYQHFEQRGGAWWTGRVGWVAGGGAVAFGAYYVSCIETVPYTGRRHSIMFVSRRQEQALGRMVFDSQCEEAARDNKLLPPHHPYSRLVRTVGMRVAAAASDDDPSAGNLQHMKGLDWQFAVIRSSVPNAFVVPGGKVVVFTGLLDLLSSEDELAAVLAHETSHVLARHHAERMSTMNVFALARLLFYALFGFSLPQAVLMLGIFLPYSRRAEHEADAIGLRVMARACYDPGACPTMLAKLQAKEKAMERGGVSMPALLRTHPPTEDRVSMVRKQLPEAYAEYQRHCAALRGLFDSQVSSGGWAPGWP